MTVGDVDAIALASVVPALTAALEAVAERRDRPLIVAGPGTMPLAIRVDRPADVGADRLVNALAAARLHGTPAVVVDFGTATTLDCVAADGAYVGGAIAPGLELGLEALAARTAKLPRIELRAPDRAIGRDTVSAMQAGTVFGYQALAAGLLDRVRRELADANGVAAGRGQGDPDRRAVGGAVGACPRRHRRDRPGPDAQGPGHPPRRGRWWRAARAGADVSGRLEGRLVGLGVTGSIAAYKAVELLRLLRAEGADVAVMLTPTAARFVGPLSFAALSRHPVETDMLELLPDGRIGHIVVGDAADVVVVAPATAHWLGSMANGLAGDVVTATCLATSAPVVVAPAMDGDMWTHPATVANVDRLRAYGYAIVEPDAGPLASGQSGVGRLAELERIVDAVVAAVEARPVRQPDPSARPPIVRPARDADLDGRHIVVTAGGTREAIDPVRFIGNRSTGRMGVAVAEAALDRGARVTLIASNVEVPLPAGAIVVHAESTAALDMALMRVVHAPDGSAGFDALVMAAAVADFRPVEAAPTKLARADGPDHPARIDARPARGDRDDRPRAGQRRRADARTRSATPLPRRLRGRDRVARACPGEAPPQGRRPAGGERRRRGRVRLRHGHEPGHHPGRRRIARGAAAPVEAGGRRAAARPGRRRAGRARCRRAD